MRRPVSVKAFWGWPSSDLNVLLCRISGDLCLSVVDAYTRECLALETDVSLSSGRVTRVLEEVIAEECLNAHWFPHAKRCADDTGSLATEV
jgi:hypothetical protein